MILQKFRCDKELTFKRLIYGLIVFCWRAKSWTNTINSCIIITDGEKKWIKHVRKDGLFSEGFEGILLSLKRNESKWIVLLYYRQYWLHYTAIFLLECQNFDLVWLMRISNGKFCGSTFSVEISYQNTHTQKKYINFLTKHTIYFTKCHFQWTRLMTVLGKRFLKNNKW